jgi:hypothetical protein
MYVAKSPHQGGILCQGGIVFPRTLATDRVLQEQLVACASDLAREQESCADLDTIVLKGMGASTRPPAILLESPNETVLRGYLLRWHRLSEAMVGSCSVIGDVHEFESSVHGAVGHGFEIVNRPESQDDVSFYPAYRLLERAAQLSKRISDQGAAATACWRIAGSSSASHERQLRINLVRLQRSWIPPRIRKEQEELAAGFLASSLTAHQFVIVPETVHAPLVRSLLEDDAAVALEPSGFSQSVVREHSELSAANLPRVANEDTCLGDAVQSGFLFKVLLSQVTPLRNSIADIAPKSPRRVFVSYSHKDKEFASQLSTSCAQLRRDGWIDLWSDAEILPGGNWRKEIYSALEQADLVLFLISPDFIQSDFCYGIEMRRALERHADGRARVIPIVIRATDTAGAPFAQLQMLPTDSKPITGWTDRDSAWLDVARGLRRLLEALARSKP